LAHTVDKKLMKALFAPTFYDLISPAILIPPFIAESSYCLWLLVKGVDVPKWMERTSFDTVGGASTPLTASL
jgi:hypothetical protein